MKKIKILINTDSAGLHSGLAETTRNIFIPLLERYPEKYEIHQLGWFHLAQRENVPWPIYPTKINKTDKGPQVDHHDRYGQQTFPGLVEKIQPDIVFAYGDLWTFDHILTSPLRNSFRLMCYYTVDGQPYFGHINPDSSTHWGDVLCKADRLVTLSHFGKDTLMDSCKELEGMDISVRYHPLNPNIFPNFSDEQVQTMRRQMLPKDAPEDMFLCGWLGRNQFRKQNFKLWELQHYMIYGDYIECKDCNRISIKEWNHSARKTKNPKTGRIIDQLTIYDADYDYSYCSHCKSGNIKEGVPDDKFYMWFHMAKTDPGYNPDLHERMWKTAHRSIYTSNTNGLVGVSKQDIAKLLSCWDTLYYPSGGEGFGNPAFEALAAGTPVGS
jgi:glycosyltransferase involved in cell wall biosynthesis